MADEQHRWLDRETAERLLSGEPLDAADDATREEADRLARTLGALSAKPPLTGEELPGEGAALAAFRKVRADHDSERAALRAPDGMTVSDAGLVRIGARAEGRTRAARGPWRGRPVRLGLAAALAVTMVGGAAVAAGTGVLDTPFHDDDPRPAASVSVAEPPERPLVPPSPAPRREQPRSATPDASTGGPAVGDPGASGDDTPSPGGETGKGTRDARGGWRAVSSGCRDLREGRRLDHDRKRALREAAGGHSRVRAYCAAVLGDSDGGRDEGWGRGGGGRDDSDGRGDGDGDGHDGRGDDEGGGEGRDDSGPGRTGSGPRSPVWSAALAPDLYRRPTALLPTPSAAYSTL